MTKAKRFQHVGSSEHHLSSFLLRLLILVPFCHYFLEQLFGGSHLLAWMLWQDRLLIFYPYVLEHSRYLISKMMSAKTFLLNSESVRICGLVSDLSVRTYRCRAT